MSSPSHTRSMRRIISAVPFLALLTLFSSLSLIAQGGIVVESNDVSEWPLVRTRFIALDEEARPIPGLSASTLSLLENGQRREIVAIDCPSAPATKDLSAVLTIDVSGSMVESIGGRADANILLAREAAEAWVDALPEGGSESAVTAFDDHALVMNDLTTDRAALRQALVSLMPNGGTNYEAAFLAELSGALKMVARGRHRRVIVFLTDGLSDTDPAPIIAEAKRLDAALFCVTLGMRAPAVLKRIAEETGGAWFENVTRVDEAKMIYRAILHTARGGEPCVMTWRSGDDCDPNRVVTLGLGSSPVAPSRLEYLAPNESVPVLMLEPALVHIESISGDGTTAIVASGAPVRIERIESIGSTAGFTIEAGALPVTLAAGDRRTVRIRRSGSAKNVAQFRVVGSCSSVPLTARFGGGMQTNPLRLVVPNGGETFRAGETTTIQWSGVPKDEIVRLDYSIDAGATWTTITDSATGLSHVWRVTGPQSDRCLARVSTLAQEMGEAATLARIPYEHHVWAIDPTGKTILSFSGDTTRNVRHPLHGAIDAPASNFVIVDATTGAVRRSFTVVGDDFTSYKNNPSPTRIEIDPTGRYAFEGRYMIDLAKGEVLWWQSADAVNVHAYMADDYLTSSFSSDGDKVLAQIGKDGGSVLGVLDSKSGRTISTMGDHTLGVFTGAFSPEGKNVVVAGRDGVKIYEASSGRLVRTLSDGPSYTAVYSPSGTQVAARFNESDSMHVWEVASTSAAPKAVFVGKNTSGYHGARFSPDGRGVIAWRNNLPSVVDIVSGATLTEYGERDARGNPVHNSMRLFYSPDGATAISIELLQKGHRKAVVYDAVAATPITYGLDSGSYVGATAAITPDGTRFVRSYGYGIKIADISGGSGRDVSDSLWRIVGDPLSALASIDFGVVDLGQKKDSVLRRALVNNGTSAVRVTAIDIASGDRGDFALISPNPPFDLPPGGSQAVEFRFVPTAVGDRSAGVTVMSDVGPLSSTVSGEGTTSAMSLASNEIMVGDVELGETGRKSATPVRIADGATTATIASASITGPNSELFALDESLDGATITPGSPLTVDLTFTPDTVGLVSTTLRVRTTSGDVLTIPVHGRGIGAAERYPDPTTFRTVAVPNAVIPPAGTLVLGSYDLAGLMAGYAITDNIFLLVGGLPPLPDDWGGTNGTAANAFSAGVKAGFSPADKWDVAVGFQYAQSFYDKEETPEVESRITLPTPFAAVSYGTDERRVSLTGGFAFKRHRTLVDASIGLIDDYPKEAPIVALGGDWQLADRWKVAAEAIYMGTVGNAPIVTSVRYFGRTWALDLGAAWMMIETGEDEPAALPVYPVVSFVWARGI